MDNIIELIMMCGIIWAITILACIVASGIEQYAKIKNARKDSHLRFVEKHDAYLKRRIDIYDGYTRSRSTK